MSDTQQCPRCKRHLSVDAYHPAKWGKKGNYCKACCNEYKVAWRETHGSVPRSRRPAKAIVNRLERPPRKLPTKYYSAHQRIGRLKGPASAFTCSSCGERPAIHWAYIGGAPDEMYGRSGGGSLSPFSNMLNRYTPLCGRCHTELDKKPCGCSCHLFVKKADSA